MCSLIASPRFRPGDLEHWRSLELADRLYAQRYKAKLEKMADNAMQAIADFLQKTAYCSVSWGKDSTVTAYLVNQVDSSIPMVRTASNRDNPDSTVVRDAFLRFYSSPYDEIMVCLADDDRGESAKEVSAFFAQTQTKYGDRRILGLRGQESATRRLQMFQHGTATANVCRPIIYWTEADVFAFLLLKDLPVHPVYAMSNGGQFPRKALRVDVLGDKKGNQFGRQQWEELYYRDVLYGNHSFT